MNEEIQKRIDDMESSEFAGLSKELYETYCKAVGGVAFNNDPLPSWEDFIADENKQKQAQAWILVAKTAIAHVEWYNLE